VRSSEAGAEREERDERDVASFAGGEEVGAGAVGDAERILDAGDVGRRGGFLELSKRYVTDADGADLPFVPHVDHRPELIIESHAGVGADDTKVHDWYLLE